MLGDLERELVSDPVMTLVVVAVSREGSMSGGHDEGCFYYRRCSARSVRLH